MEVIAVNGRPRKKWNIATLLKNALDGAVSGEMQLFTERTLFPNLTYSNPF